MKVTKEIFRQTKPCSDCPFLRDTGVRHGAAAVVAYASYFCDNPSATFPCHQSVDQSLDRTEWAEWQPGQTICAGGIIFATKTRRMNDLMAMAARVGWINPAKFRDADRVFDSIGEMVLANSGK